MEEIKFRDKVQKERFYKLYNEKWHLLTKDLELLIKNVIVIFKRHSNDESYITLALIYWMLYFWIIDNSHEILEKSDSKKIKLIRSSFKYEMEWDYKNFLDIILAMEKDLFLFKTVIKYSILSFEKKFIKIAPNQENYYKSIWYILPYLTYIESPFLGFFQDVYFKKVYPKKYEKVRKFYREKVDKIEFPWEHMFTMVNNLTNIMMQSESFWNIKVRRKTYFSIYNKRIRKKWNTSMDNIWIRVIFPDIENLKKFVKLFEEKYVFIEKKDYVKKPKINWYKSIHFKYISPYRDSQVLVELQLRTILMDKEIHSTHSISHFNYTINQNKWSKNFKEIQQGYTYTSKILEIK